MVRVATGVQTGRDPVGVGGLRERITRLEDENAALREEQQRLEATASSLAAADIFRFDLSDLQPAAVVVLEDAAAADRARADHVTRAQNGVPARVLRSRRGKEAL